MKNGGGNFSHLIRSAEGGQSLSHLKGKKYLLYLNYHIAFSKAEESPRVAALHCHFCAMKRVPLATNGVVKKAFTLLRLPANEAL
jgi:hypothetical protein